MSETFQFLAGESAKAIESRDFEKARELLGRLRSLKRELEREIETMTEKLFGN